MIIKSRKNQGVQKYKNLIREKKERLDLCSFICEGEKLSFEALNSGLLPASGFFTTCAKEKSADLYKKASELCEISEISTEISEYISDTKTPQGVFLEFPLLDKSENLDKIIVCAKKLVLLSSLQDPGNEGAIIRTAEALGMDGVILSEDCPDIHSAKVLRASAGSVFRIPAVTGNLPGIISALKRNGFVIYGSLLDKTAVTLKNVKFNEKSAIIIGNEGSGISKAVADLCDERIYIPIKGAESLNAGIAAGIIMWELLLNNI